MRSVPSGSAWQRTSRNRTPALSCCVTVQFWHCTHSAVTKSTTGATPPKRAPESCVPGMVMPLSGASSASRAIQRGRSIGGSSAPATTGRTSIAAGASAAARRTVRRLIEPVTCRLPQWSARLRVWFVLAHDHRTRRRVGLQRAGRIDSEQPVRHHDGPVHINARQVGQRGGDV